MNNIGQQTTKLAYEDPEIVEGYIQRNALKPKNLELIRHFGQLIKGNKILDLGCGPGQDSYALADLGFDVTGLDYSAEMIRRAESLKTHTNRPRFVVGDMRQLTSYFAHDAFDAIWASASLIHIHPNDLPQTLGGITKIVKTKAIIYVGLKQGSGTIVVAEDKLGKPMQREFTLWTRDEFVTQTKPYGWILTEFGQRQGSIFRGQPTEWLNFFFKISK